MIPKQSAFPKQFRSDLIDPSCPPAGLSHLLFTSVMVMCLGLVVDVMGFFFPSSDRMSAWLGWGVYYNVLFSNANERAPT
jgi:hypothetical protein